MPIDSAALDTHRASPGPAFFMRYGAAAGEEMGAWLLERLHLPGFTPQPILLEGLTDLVGGRREETRLGSVRRTDRVAQEGPAATRVDTAMAWESRGLRAPLVNFMVARQLRDLENLGQ